MRLSRIYPSLALVLLSSLATVMPIIANAETGFWSVEQVNPAPGLRVAVNSVLRVTVLAGEELDIDMSRFQKAEAAMGAFPDATSISPSEILLRRRALDRCYDEIQVVCRVLAGFESGTLFFVGDSRTAISTLHVFSDTLRSSRISKVDLVIQDRYGKVVYGLNSDDKAETLFMQEGLGENPKNGLAQELIGLKLEVDLVGAVPLRFAAKDANLGEMVYQVGFPGETNDRFRLLGKPDSNGQSQSITYGSAIDVEAYLMRIGQNPASMSEADKSRIASTFLISDSDGYFGMSGGPSLNAKGEVLGLIVAAYPADGAARKDPAVISLKANYIKALISRGK